MEANNIKIMREVLSEIVLLTVKAGKSISCDVACGIIASKAKHALKQPPRNCDVGTAEEQAERYGRYCDKFTSDGMHCETCPCCGKIPLGKCEFAWAQMPYEEGGAK